MLKILLIVMGSILTGYALAIMIATLFLMM
jgi:hypothetical protein